MRKLTEFAFIALLLSMVPASASNLVLPESGGTTLRIPAVSDADASRCSLPHLPIRTDNPLSLSRGNGNESAFDSSSADERWAPNAASHANADMNRTVDHLLKPPEHVRVYATQTGDDLRGRFEGANSPNATFAAFEVVFH